MARPRKYPPELLDRGARLVFESNRPIDVARDLGVPSETLRKYVRQVEADEGAPSDRTTTAEREEIKQLRKECTSCAAPTRSSSQRVLPQLGEDRTR